MELNPVLWTPDLSGASRSVVRAPDVNAGITSAPLAHQLLERARRTRSDPRDSRRPRPPAHGARLCARAAANRVRPPTRSADDDAASASSPRRISQCASLCDVTRSRCASASRHVRAPHSGDRKRRADRAPSRSRTVRLRAHRAATTGPRRGVKNGSVTTDR